jgi:hypothetical protein
MSDVAGLGRRALQAVELLRGAADQGLTVLTAGQVVVDAEVPEVPVGIDGETVMMPTPVCCTIRPKAVRARVPRNRPWVPPPRPPSTGRHCGNWPPPAPLTAKPLTTIRSPGRVIPTRSDTSLAIIAKPTAVTASPRGRLPVTYRRAR